MSYARLGADGSQVYIYDDVTLGLRCCWCAFTAAGVVDFSCGEDGPAMVAHIGEHRAAGHRVPEYVDAEILADYPGERITP